MQQKLVMKIFLSVIEIICNFFSNKYFPTCLFEPTPLLNVTISSYFLVHNPNILPPKFVLNELQGLWLKKNISIFCLISLISHARPMPIRIVRSVKRKWVSMSSPTLRYQSGHDTIHSHWYHPPDCQTGPISGFTIGATGPQASLYADNAGARPGLGWTWPWS